VALINITSSIYMLTKNWNYDDYHCFNFLIMICLEEDSRLQEITLLIQQYSYMNSLIMSEFVSYARQSGRLVWFMVLNTTFNNISVTGIHMMRTLSITSAKQYTDFRNSQHQCVLLIGCCLYYFQDWGTVVVMIVW
jgi:hypothetical protein